MTFFISMLILLMQFTWKHMAELIGKGAVDPWQDPHMGGVFMEFDDVAPILAQKSKGMGSFGEVIKGLA